MPRIIEIDPASYRRHAIHQEGRIWAETNCYADLWIELLHALGHEPAASLAFTVSIDFEGDQWTFFKCPHGDLLELYGLDVHELAIWRSLSEHIEEQVERGRPVLVELDSYFLPDTAGTAYRRLHWKTTVAINEIDVAQGHMGYFHNQGYYRVGGDDFLDVLRLRGAQEPALLPPYVEFVKLNAATAGGIPMRERSLGLLRRHLALAPVDNPFPRFRTRLASDLEWLMRSGLDTFHQYSFATLRQYGACFELTKTFFGWLAAEGERDLQGTIEAFGTLSEGAKTFQFQLARAMNRGKPPDLSPLDVMADRWEGAMQLLRARYG